MHRVITVRSAVRMPEFWLVQAHLRGVVHVLLAIRDFQETYKRDPYTRELLAKLKSWGHGHKMLKLAEKLGLVRRYEGYVPWSLKAKIRCVYNTLTELGKLLVDLILQMCARASSDDDDG